MATRAKVYMPPPAMVEAIIAPNGRVAVAKARENPCPDHQSDHHRSQREQRKIFPSVPILQPGPLQEHSPERVGSRR
jgi:hypothetical protein